MFFAILTLFSALGLATVAGWFSIIGIMTIYAGAAIRALIMGVALESGKLVTTSWLYRNWKFADWKLKTPLVIFTVVLMIITSIGVFGFLSKAHLQQGAPIVNNDAKVQMIDQQIKYETSIITQDQNNLNQLDSELNNYITHNRSDHAVYIRRKQQPERDSIQADMNAAQQKISDLNNQKFQLQSQVRNYQLEVGPIRYISELIYGNSTGQEKQNMESAVRMFTLMIVSTLDPLAVILLIAANHTILRRQNEKKAAKETIPEVYQAVVTTEPTLDLPIPPVASEEASPDQSMVEETKTHPIPDDMSAVSDLLETMQSLRREENTTKTVEEPTANEPKPQDVISPQSNQAWAQQSAKLNEIIGSGIHFIPKKVEQPSETKVDKPTTPQSGSWISDF